MTDFKVLRYFAPTDSDTFTAGWYLTDNDDGLTRVGDMIPADDSAVYGVANQIIIDSNTPDDSTAGGVSPLSGGAGLDQFLITSTANSVTIDDDSGDNMIVFALDVEIKSITSEASGVSPVYVITLSTDKVITVRNPSSFTFQHLGDTTRTAPISAAEFLTAYPNQDPVAGPDIEEQSGTAAGQEIKPIDLSGLFTDSNNDELALTLAVMLDGSAIDFEDTGLKYDPLTKNLFGTPNAEGTYTITVTASDSRGGTNTSTFNIVVGPFEPVIELSNLVYNVGGEVIVISQDNLLTSHGSQDDLSMLVYVIQGLPTNGTLWKGDTQLDDQDGSNSFTQEDVNNGLITYRSSDSSSAQSDSFSFVVLNSAILSPKQVPGVFQITPREDVDVQNPEEDNTIDRSGETAPQKIDTGDGSDTITGGEGDDQIDAGAGDDEITLTRDDNGEQVDAGADEVLYTFGYGGDGTDGGDAIKGFRRGQDKLKFVVNSDRTDITTLTAFLESLEGADGEALTDDDAFIVTMMWGFDENGVFYFDGVLLHFKEASAFSNGPLSSPVVSITFDERLDFDDLVEILGGAENVANNFDGGLTAFKNLDEVLPRLFGENSIDFEVRPIDEVSVVDGPVASAEVFFDLNGDGEVTDAEKDAQRDDSGRSRYLTGDDGTVDIPEQYVGRAFVAVVGSAYDIDSGERLEGEFRSLDKGRGGIATPITDLIVTYLEEVEGQVGTPTTEQEVLDEIFGDGVVTLADVLDAGNYEIPADTDTPENNKKDLISRAAIALTEIKENDDLADGDDDGSTTKVEIVSAIKTLVDSPDDSSVADLKAAVDARVAEVNAVRGGKPIATPASVDGVEDTDYAFPDTSEALTGLFGFRDPSGNDPAADTSSFRGVYIRIDIENASLRLDDNTQVVADTDLSGSDTVDAIAGYVYVTFDKLSTLKLSPAGDFNGDLALVYRVWDGEEVSSDAELIINIAEVNDAPVAGTDIASQSGTVGEKITDIDLSGLFTDIDGDEVVLTFTVTLAGSTAANADTGLSIRNDMLTGTLSGSLAAGDYTITVTATDPSGEMGTSEFTFTVLEKTIEGGNAATIVENDLVTYFATGTLTSSVSGTITLDGADGSGNLEATYGTMTFDGSVWRYELNNEDDDTQMLRDGDTEEEVFTFRDGTTSFTVTITVSGVNDAPVVESGDEIIEQAGRIGQEITAIDLSGLFTDVDTGDTLTLTVVLDDGSALSTIGLSYDPVANEITGTPILTGLHTIKVAANDGSVTSVATFDIVVASSDSILGYVGQFITEIDLGNLFTNPSGVKLTVTFLDSGGNEVDNTGLEYNPVTAKITGTPAITGTYTIKAVLSNSAGTQIGEATIFNLVLKALQPPTLTFVDAQVEANADFTIIEDSGQPAGPIVPINLSTLFATVNGQRVTVTLENGDALSTIGLEYSSTSKAVTGALTKFGTFTIVASGGGKTGTFIVTTDPYKTPTEVIQIDDPDVLFDNPHLSSRNQVGIRVGAKGGSADDVAAARTDLKSDYGDSDVRVFAPTDITDTEEEFIVEGEYGRFVITLLRGGDAPDGSPAELRYYYERYQDGEINYKNINALKEGEIAYDVLTIWAFDGLTDVEFAQLIDSDGNTPQSAVDRQVFKTVVVEITGANDAPEVVSETFDVLFTDSQAVSIDIDPDNFFDVDGDELTITVTLDNDSALSTIGLAYDPVTGKITGVPNAAGPHTIKVTATDGGSESASYTFVLSSNAGDVNTQPVVVISGEQELEVIAGIEVASDTDTGFDITYSDADDDHRDNDEVVYSFYQLGLDEDGNTIRIRPADNLEVSEDGSIMLKAGAAFISDLRLEVVATDGEGSESVPQPFTITVLSRVPTASPATVAIDEDSDYAFPDAAQELTDLLGFADPEGNSDGQSASSFEGIYIKLSSIINGALLQDDNTVVDASSAEADAPAKDGYIYVTLATLGGLKLRPSPDFNGDLDLVYQVWDGEDASGDATLTITVRGVNDVPVASDVVLADQNLRAGTTFEPMDLAALKALFTDVDGEDLTITVAFFETDGTTPAEIGLTYSETTGIVGTLNNDLSSGDYKVTITANDGTATAERTFTITAVNDTPTAMPMGGVEIDEDTDYVFAGKDLTALFGFSDPEGNSDGQPTSSFEGIYIKQDSILNGTLFFVPSDGTAATELDLSAIGGYFYVPLSILGKLKFTPDPNFNGAMELVYQVRDGEEVSGDATLTITVNAVNDVPELLPNTEIENQDENVGQLIDPISEGDLRARFADADTDNAALVLTVMVLDGSTRTALDTIGLEYNSTNGIIGTPNDAGTYTIEVTASDGEESIAFTFDIVVVHPPVIAIGDGDPTEIGEDTESPITGTLTITDQDSSGPFQSIVLTDDSDDADDGIVMGDYGTLTFDSDTNAWSYMVDERAQALNDDAPGTDRFVFTSEGATDFELVITVTGSNDAPEIAKVDMDLEGVETILGNIEGGRLNRLIVQDSDTDASVFTSESFTITGDQAEKFIVKKDDDGRWYLFLKDGESLDHADLEEVTLNLQIKVSDGINESNTVDINIGAARGYFRDENAHGGVVYQARAEGDAAGTRYSIKSGIREGDLFIIDGEDGEVRFKPSSIPVTFDIDGEFSFIIIERSGGDVTETVVTLYNNVPSVFSRATSADSPEDQALGYTIGPDEPTDADGVASIEYYWFAHTRPRGDLFQTSDEELVAGKHATVKPLEGENDRLLTLKGEHAEKELWLIIVLTDEDGYITYNLWAPNPGRYDIADTVETALDLADIGMSNNDNSGDFDFVGDIGNSDSDYIKFTVEPGETLVIDIGGPGSYEAKYRVIREDGSPVENQSETLVRRDAREDLNLLEAGTYILRVTQQGQSAGPYKVSFQGIDDKPTAFALSDTVTELASDAELSAGQKVGVLTITDDTYGTNTIILAGADVALFEIRETSNSDRLVKELWLKAGINFSTRGGETFNVIASVEGTGEGSNPAPETLTITVNPVPVLFRMDLEGVETILGNIEGGRLNRLIVKDSDTDASVFTSESFTITGDQAEKFIVKKDDDGRWYLFLKDGESLDHADLEEVTLNLQIKVSDGINESNTVDINIGAARGYFFDGNDHEGVVYQARAEGDATGTRYSIKSGIREGDLFIINGENGEVTFKPGFPATFDIDGEFSFIIIERSGGVVTETVVTFYNNVHSVFSPATDADSPEDQALGYIIGPDEPTDADGVASIEYYWFAHTRPRGELRGISNENLVAGEHATVKPLEGENDRLLTLKREHIEKEIWLIIVLTDEDGFVTYNSWAPNPGRYDIADTIETALDLADIGMSNNDNSGDFDYIGDIGNSDSDYIKFTVEPGETLVIDIGGPGSYEAKYRVIREDGSPVENQSETLVRRDAREDLNLLEAGTYILRVTQQGQSAGPYKVSFQGIDDKPTAFVLSDTVTELASDAELSAGQKVGVLTITDDTYGTNTIILAGADVALFEIRETSNSDRLVKELWLKAGINFSTRGGETFNVIASVEGTGEGSNPAPETFELNIRGAGGGASGASDETDPGAVLGNGIEGAVIGDETDTLGQILIGGDNAQTLNAGEGGDMIIGGRGDDTINLGTGADTVLYRYDGAEDTAPTAHDGGDVINDFDVDEDTLILAEAENESIYTDTAEFYDAIKGVSLIVDGDGNITGVVFTFAGQDGPDQDAATQEIDLTVNFEEDDFVTPSDIDLTAFEDAEDGERAITDGEETAAYEVIDAILGVRVELANFDDLGIELNPAETDII